MIPNRKPTVWNKGIGSNSIKVTASIKEKFAGYLIKLGIFFGAATNVLAIEQNILFILFAVALHVRQGGEGRGGVRTLIPFLDTRMTA